MPVDPYIARGIVPLGAGLLDVAQYLGQQRVMNERTQLAREGQQFDERRYADSQAQAQQQYTQEQHKQELTQGLSRVKWLLANPNLAGTLAADPQRAGVLSEKLGMDVLSAPEQEVRARLKQLEADFSAQLGQGPPQPEYRTAGEQIVEVPTERGQPFKPVYTAPPPRRAPAQPEWREHVDENGNLWYYDANAPDPNKTLRPAQTPGGRQLGSPPRAADQPRIYGDPTFGFYSQNEQGAMQQLPTIPYGGAPAAPAAGEQRAVSKSGKPIVFRNGRWEYE